VFETVFGAAGGLGRRGWHSRSLRLVLVDSMAAVVAVGA